MAPLSKTLALAGAFFAIAGFAQPLERRGPVVWKTVTEVEWTTVEVTTTIQPTQVTSTATLVPVSASAAPTQPAEKEKQPEPATTSTSTQAPAPAPSSEDSSPAPEPTTQQPAPAPAPSPEPSSEPAPAPAPELSSTSTSTAPAETSTGGGSGGSSSGPCSSGSPCTGQLTFYDTATSASAPSSCGFTNDGGNERVLALPVGIMKDGDCGKMVKIEYNGKTTHGKVVDKCMGCDDSSIDLSRALFGDLASESVGRIHGAKWSIQ